MQPLRYCLLLLAFCVPYSVLAQRQWPQNRPNYHKRPYFFGFHVGVNSGRFDAGLKSEFFLPDSIINVQSQNETGFHIGPTAHLRLSKYFSVRFLPGYAFQDRTVQFSVINSKVPGGRSLIEKRVQASVLEFPVNFTYRTARINNFSAYAILGGKYGVDLQSQHKVEQQAGPRAILKTKPGDFGIESGAGFNFYLPYFKFGIELKYTVGLTDVLIHDNTTYARTLEHLRTRLFTIGFTFEG